VSSTKPKKTRRIPKKPRNKRNIKREKKRKKKRGKQRTLRASALENKVGLKFFNSGEKPLKYSF
jgi:hypothetical protein